MTINFDTQLKDSLSNLSPKKVCFFAWLCAVRALPFLAIGGNFDFWKNVKGQDDRQRQLFAMLNALDVTLVRNAANVSYDDTYTAVNIAANIVANNVANTAKFAAYVAASATATANPKCYNPDYYAVNAAVYATNDIMALEPILLEDIDTINAGKYNFNSYIALYGEVWDKFKDALRDMSCGYWADWYGNLFNKGFKVDEDALKEIKMRLNVPREIQEQGAKAVVEYLENAQNQGLVSTQRETRLIILGSAGAGKTTLVKRLKGDKSDLKPEESTHGVDTSVALEFDGIKTRVWDFGGQVIYHSSHRCFISKNCVYVLVVNARTEENRDINRINYWLDTIRVYSDNKAKVFVLLNESDNRKQNLEDCNEFKQGEFGSLIQDIYSFNISKDMTSVDNFKKELATYIEAVGHQTFGRNDSCAMKGIQNLFTHGQQILGADELDRILKANGINAKKDQQRVKELFNTLGVALGYGFMEGYVLDPYWISHGVYNVIDYLQNNKSVFINYSELDVVFANERGTYPAKKREYILKLMEHYKIGFRDEGGLRGLAVPCATSQSKPNNVILNIEPENLVTWIERDELLEFPADFFYRYICGNQKDIQKIGERWAMWQVGAVLEGPHANALVELTENRRIKITVWGEGKEEYSKQLNRLIHELFQEYRLTPHEEERKRGGKVIKFIELVVEAAAKGAMKAGIETVSGNAMKQ